MNDLTMAQAKRLIEQRVWDHFLQWTRGQTGPLVRDAKGKRVCGIFKHDVERYLDSILRGRPTYFD